MSTLKATYLVGSTLVCVGVEFSGYSYSSPAQVKAALDLKYRVSGQTAWQSLANMENPVTKRSVYHLYHNDFQFERNMWRACLTGLSPFTTYEMKVVLGSDETSVSTFTTDNEPSDVELSFDSSWTSSQNALKTAVQTYWDTLWESTLKPAGLYNLWNGNHTTSPYFVQKFSDVNIGGEPFGGMVWCPTSGVNVLNQLNAELADTAGTTFEGKRCMGAYWFLHETRHILGIASCDSNDHIHRQGWHNRGVFNNFDVHNSSYIELGNYETHYITTFPNTVGAYANPWANSERNLSGVQYYYSHDPVGEYTYNTCQIGDVLKFVYGCPNVKPLLTYAHSNFWDTQWGTNINGSWISSADVEAVFYLRALMFHKITIVTTT